MEENDEPIETQPYKESGLICETCGYTDSLECRVFDYETGEDVVTILCGEHAAKQGYCCCCGEFCAGMTSFDFIHPGYCDNCYEEVKSSDDDDEESYDELGYATYPADDPY